MEFYQGAWPTMVTPLDEKLNIDRDGYIALIDWYISHGAGGLYANCATSEMDILSADEQMVLVQDAVLTSDGRVPVAATGNMGTTIDEQVTLCQSVADAGADIVMLVVPAGNMNDDDLERYFMTFAETVSSPFGIYEWPIAGMRHLNVDLVGKLARTGRFLAYKETSCDIGKLGEILRVTDSTPLALLQANIPYLLPFIKAGGRGTMSISSAFVPDLVDAVIKSALAEESRVESLHQALCVMDLAQRAVHPAGTKYLLQKRGVPMASRTRRIPHDLTPEQRYALDYTAAEWFDTNGELRVLNE